MTVTDQFAQALERGLLPALKPHVSDLLAAQSDAILTDSRLTEALARLIDEQTRIIKAELFAEPPIPPLYPDVISFVVKELCPYYGKTAGRSSQVNWTPEWHKHPEAIKRFTALWCRFEKLRIQEPDTYLETFYRLHADYHMDRIMKPDGVFADCKKADTPLIPLPTSQPSKDEE